MRKNVLLVEDDTVLGEVYCRVLQKAGLNVLHTSTSKAAINAAKKNPPDLVVLDIILGKENGFVFLKHLRREAKTMDVPVVIVTNLQTSEIGLKEELSTSLGVVGVYTKSQLSLKKLTEIAVSVLKQHD